MKRFISVICAMLALGVAGVKAQSYRMVLEKTNGETLRIPTNEIKKMWFESLKSSGESGGVPGDGSDYTENASGLNLEMVYVEQGSFVNGDSTIKVDHPYYIGKYEITQDQWAKIMGTYPSNFSGANMPVENISMEEAIVFCEKLSKMTGKRYVLPSKAEWEYAARGGIKSQGYAYSGSNYISDVAWYSANSDGGPHIVGSKSPNELGIYDMSGNVSEYCYSFSGIDDWNIRFFRSRAGNMITRGGDWNTDTTYCRSAADSREASTAAKSQYFGFRVVMLMEKPEEVSPAPLSDFRENAFGVNFDMVYVETDNTYYHIGENEVTQAQWKAVMGSNPSNFTGNNLPVENVSWYDAQLFCIRLSEKTGRKYALPTSEEWIYAAKGGKQTHGYTYSGSNNIDEVAWYYGNSGSQTHNVRTKMANELGIYDMSGNVWEWCDESSGSSRVIRGGSWGYDASNCEVSSWNAYIPGYRSISVGFRLVLLP